jgi:hypothetical protein
VERTKERQYKVGARDVKGQLMLDVTGTREMLVLGASPPHHYILEM